MNYVMMYGGLALGFLLEWLGFPKVALWPLGASLVCLFEIVVTDAVAAGIKKAKEEA